MNIEEMTEDQAADLVEKLKKHFNWQGTLFYTADVADEVNSHNEDCEDDEKITVEEVKASSVWRRQMEDQMISEGFEAIREAIFNVIRDRKDK